MKRSRVSAGTRPRGPQARLPYRDLRTDRLHLREPRAGDAPEIFRAYGSDPEATRFLTWRPHAHPDDAVAAVRGRLDRLQSGIEYSWVIEATDSGEVVGMISAWPGGDAAEVGFVLARPCWGRGLATEALIAVTRWALSAPGIAEVWATCDAENHASARVLEKAGLRNRGPFERRIVRPNLSAEPRPSLHFTTLRQPGER